MAESPNEVAVARQRGQSVPDSPVVTTEGPEPLAPKNRRRLLAAVDAYDAYSSVYDQVFAEIGQRIREEVVPEFVELRQRPVVDQAALTSSS